MTNKPKPMKVKKPNPVKLMNHVSMYDPAFKKAVILYAEKKSNSEAQRRFGIHESSIRRWRKIKADILEKAKKPSKRSKALKPAVGSKAVSNKIGCQCDLYFFSLNIPILCEVDNRKNIRLLKEFVLGGLLVEVLEYFTISPAELEFLVE